MFIECSKCGAKNQLDKPPQPGSIYRCGNCNQTITIQEIVGVQSETTRIPNMVRTNGVAVENTSGHGSQAVIPPEIRGWNWGAFFLGWIWGVGNNIWISLLTFIPYLGFVMVIILGVKGNEWAWQRKRWDSVEHFKRTQGTWAKWGVFWFAVSIIITIIITIIMVRASSSLFNLMDSLY